MDSRKLIGTALAIAVAAAVGPLAGPIEPAAADSGRNSMHTPVIMVHGVTMNGDSGHDCQNDWHGGDPKDPNHPAGFIDKYKQMYRETDGHNGKDPREDMYTFATIAYYDGDTNCNSRIDGSGPPMTGADVDRRMHERHFGGGHIASTHGETANTRWAHTRDTPIEHLAYHLAWFIKNRYGTVNVDIVAHSMGGLIVRYMLQQIQAGHPDFPTMSQVNIEDVVTWSTPFNGGGSGMFKSAQWCDAVPGDTGQCGEMMPGSDFLKKLATNPLPQDTVPNPNRVGSFKTDWTVFGSQSDWVVGPDSATYIAAPHKRVYEGYFTNLGHGGYFKDSSDADDQDVYYWNKGMSPNLEDPSANVMNGVFWKSAPHALRWTVLSLRDDYR